MLAKSNLGATSSALPVFDEALVIAALSLTDASVSTEEDAASLFVDVARRCGQWKLPKPAPSPFVTADWESAQAAMRKWLPKLIDVNTSTRVLTDIARTSEEWGHSLRMQLGADGELQWTVERDSIGTICTRACMTFIMPNGWQPRLGQCQYEKCGKWFLRPQPKRGSVPLYCSKSHANIARVNAFRVRQHKESQ